LDWKGKRKKKKKERERSWGKPKGSASNALPPVGAMKEDRERETCRMLEGYCSADGGEEEEKKENIRKGRKKGELAG